MSPKTIAFWRHQTTVRPSLVQLLRRTSAVCGILAVLATTAAGSPGEQIAANMTSTESLTVLGGWSQAHLNMLVAVAAILGLVVSQNLSWRNALKMQHEANAPYRELADAMRAMAVSVQAHREAVDRRPCSLNLPIEVRPHHAPNPTVPA